MRLLTAPITSLEWPDVVAFCGLSLPESVTLDYKREIPSELERTIAAMANTSGGVVLVGVDEDRASTKPVMPIAGMTFVRGIPERITNLCIAHLTPPLVPEIAVLQDPAGKNVVVVVRVPQSHQAPHAVSKNTKVYLRRGGTNSPEDLASLDELEWLRSGREKSIRFREQLYARAQDRFVKFLRGIDGSGKNPVRVESDGMLSLSFSPTYPQDMLISPPRLNEVLRNIRVRDYYGTDHEFPLGSLHGVMVQDGLIVNASVNHGEWAYHTELNSFGLLFFKQSLLHPVEMGGKRLKLMRASEVFCRLDEIFDSALKFYQKLGYNGSLHFYMYLENLIGLPLGRYSADETGYDLAFCPDAEVTFGAELTAPTLAEKKGTIILAAATKLAWAFDWELGGSLLNKYYSRHKSAAVV